MIRGKKLVTTGFFPESVQQDDLIFAADWCFNGNQEMEEQFKGKVLQYPVKPQDAVEIREIILQVYLVLLSRLTCVYNERFGIKKPEKYYELLLGRWLYHFLHNVYERMALLNAAVKEHHPVRTDVCAPSIAFSFDSDDYNQKTYLSHTFNLRLFSAVARHIDGINFNVIETPETDIGWIRSQASGREKLASVYQNFLCAVNRIFTKKLILVVSPYYPSNTFINSLWFFWKSKFRVVHYRFNRVLSTPEATDAALRNKMADKIKMDNEDSLLTIASSILFSFIPHSFLENFQKLREEAIQWHRKNPNLQVLFTANAIHTEERFKYLTAEAPKAELWISQHGFGYGVNKVLSSEEYERKAATRYFTWGWGKDVLPNAKLVPPGNISYKEKSRILFTFPTISEYSGLLETPMVYSYDLPHYIQLSDSVMEGLEKEQREAVYIRQLKRTGLRYLPMPADLKIDQVPDFHSSLVNARIHLSNHFGTPFLESLAWNIPTVIIHPPLEGYLREDAIPDFEKLQRAKIIFTDPSEAANHLNEVYNDIDGWWQSENVQQAVKSFIYKYARPHQQWRSVWLRTFLQ
ncbi:hypothetical protein GWC95_04085 [Sediminibacterium roseum]|uniref:Transferase, LIC12162 family n=1 Tax=Sediminibacterium roseum TaxID=1978412 RepID=A0ABW9ZV43_9BACT|nr:LIC12162 family protein [Sediminibacterium roseum]NCI49088.1 hypothetical protein [Sediminibacterium roseum]